MPRTITDRTEIRKAIERLHFHTEIPDQLLIEWLEGVKIPRKEKMSGPMVRLRAYRSGEIVMSEGAWGGNDFCLLVDGKLDVFMRDEQTKKNHKANEVKPGESFGEMSLFAGVPRTATVIAGGSSDVKYESLVLEIDRPALRSARQREKGSDFTQELFERVGEIYQQRGLSTVIDQVRQATGFSLSQEQIRTLQSISQFRVYGRSHRLCEQGADITKVFLIRNGWVRRDYDVPFADDRGVVASASPGAHIDFIGSGNPLGLQALTLTPPQHWKYTGVVMLRTEVMEIDVSLLRAAPELSRTVHRALSSFSIIDDDQKVPPVFDPPELVTIEELVTSGIVETENVLVMDMDLCIRCGNCSLACQKVHGESRLVRRGIHITRSEKPNHHAKQHILVPQVCIHCQDPECLTYCPTGAIHRGAQGQIDINEDTCTGCLQCAQRCPYSAISMISGISNQPAVPDFASQISGWLGVSAPVLPPPETAKKNLVAAKCNLCEDTPLNPSRATSPAYSCEENCPTGALVRVNPREYFDEVEQRLGRVFRSENMLMGRNIHRRDPIRRLCHFAGWSLMLITLVGGMWLWLSYGFDQRLPILSGTLRGVTGFVGGIGVLAALSYSARRRIYRHRAGPLRYWMVAHAYLGVVAAISIIFHGGRHGGGILTTVLMFTFDLVLLTGLFGIASYYAAPRLLTSIEGDPLLLEDLQARRNEVRNELKTAIRPGDNSLDDPSRRFASFRYFLQQIVSRQELSAMLAEAREEYLAVAERLGPTERTAFIESIEKLATIRRLDALIFLHRLMKIWLPPHIIATSSMLALLVIHIMQVILFAVR